MRIMLVLVLVAMMAGCTTFQVFDPANGKMILKTNGGTLISRNDNFRVTKTGLDENNNLVEFKIERITDERADAQVEAMKIMAEALRAGATAAVLP